MQNSSQTKHNLRHLKTALQTPNTRKHRCNKPRTSYRAEGTNGYTTTRDLTAVRSSSLKKRSAISVSSATSNCVNPTVLTLLAHERTQCHTGRSAFLTDRSFRNVHLRLGRILRRVSSGAFVPTRFSGARERTKSARCLRASRVSTLDTEPQTLTSHFLKLSLGAYAPYESL